MKVELISWTNDPINTAAQACAICYNSEPSPKLVKQCIASGHLSTIEHINFTFKISGVSRSLTHQLVRHRMASYSQQSQRYANMSNVEFVYPPHTNGYQGSEYRDAFNNAIESYKTLQDLGVKNEDARAVLPNACPTEIIMTMNLRSLGHFMNERLCCFDEKTEVLTSNGWKKFKDCTLKDEFYTLNIKTDEMELIKAKKFISYPVDEKLIHLKGQSVDHFSTYDHNMVVSKSYAKNGNKKWEIMPAQEAMNCKHLSVKKNCKPIKGIMPETFTIPQTFTSQHNQYTEWEKIYEEREVPIREFLQFLGFYLSDGCCVKAGGHYNIFLSKGDYGIIEKYKNICEKITNNSVNIIKDKPNCWKIVFHDINLFNYLSDFGKAKEKFIPDFVWTLDHSLLQNLFEGFKDGDLNKKENTLTTISPCLANDFQRLLIHLGLSGSISISDRTGQNGGTVTDRNGKKRTIVNKNPVYNISINYTKNEPLMITNTRNNFSEEKYCGLVYCVELEKNYTLYIRRKGKTCWSGNCRAQQEIRAMALSIIGELKRNKDVMGLNDEEMEIILSLCVPKCESGKIKFCPENKSCGRQKTAKEINGVISKSEERAEWIYNGENVYCSLCGEKFSTLLSNVNFCPNCGIKINEGGEINV